MIVAKCPLRIPLAGGSTDLESFIQEHGYGSVISFPANLYTYITLHDDRLGYNTYSQKYVINYSSREETDTIDTIRNDVAREVLKYFQLPPSTVGFTTDIFSMGSGLASSSSYVISLIKAAAEFQSLMLSNFEVCKLGLQLERLFNPLTGYQDPYGCGLGGFKRLHFTKDQDPQVTFLSTELLQSFDMFLIYTGVSRLSTDLLKKVEQDSRVGLLDIVDRLETAINTSDKVGFLGAINEGWAYKKKTSRAVVANLAIQEMDAAILNDRRILAHRLCGAGNGGYFLVFAEKDETNGEHMKHTYEHVIPIKIAPTGAKVKRL